MTITITTELLFSILQKEKSTGELIPLQHDFYSEARKFLAVLEMNVRDDESKNTAENARNVFAMLCERRRQKLLLYIAYGKQLPASLPVVEEGLYNEIINVLNQTAQRPKPAKLRILADVPEVLTKTGKKIGPYKKGEVVELFDSSDAEFVAENKIGEAVT